MTTSRKFDHDGKSRRVNIRKRLGTPLGPGSRDTEPGEMPMGDQSSICSAGDRLPIRAVHIEHMIGNRQPPPEMSLDQSDTRC